MVGTFYEQIALVHRLTNRDPAEGGESVLTESERAFLNRMYGTYARTLLVYSFSMLRALPDAFPMAEECVQETFERAMLRMNTLSRHRSPERWLMNICRKITLSRRRKLLNRLRITGQPAPYEEIADTVPAGDNVEEWVLRNDLFERKQQLMDMLTEEERAVYRCYYEEDRSLKDSAETLNLSVNALRGAIQRIKGKLMQIMLSVFGVL